MNQRFIPLSIPNLKGNELKYVTEAVETEWVATAGPFIGQFEDKVADYVHSVGAVSCQNGTAGLHIALLLAGVTDKDAVLVPSLTFIAAVNPVKYIGAKPIFMDCDDYLCIDPVKVREFCERECSFSDGKLMENKSGRQIKALIVVHVFGNMADMKPLMEIAHDYNLKVVEDATEAIGTFYTEGVYKGKFAGTLGDVGVYSFNGNKIITTGGGGMIVSNNEELLRRAKHLTTQAKKDELYYIHDEVGYNYRMTNLQAALGLAQLEQLEKFISIKISNYYHYLKRVSEVEGLQLLPFREKVRSNRWFYALSCKSFKIGRDELIERLTSNRIQVRPIWGLINEQRPYRAETAYKIQKAKSYWQHIVNIPCSTNLSEEDIDIVMDVIESI